VQFDRLIGKAVASRPQLNQDAGGHLDPVPSVRARLCRRDSPASNTGFNGGSGQHAAGLIGHHTSDGDVVRLVELPGAHGADAGKERDKGNNYEREEAERGESNRHRVSFPALPRAGLPSRDGR
jgi:hypothetical protein